MTDPYWDELENFLAERLTPIIDGRGDWAACMQMIEKYCEQRADQFKRNIFFQASRCQRASDEKELLLRDLEFIRDMCEERERTK